MLSHSSLRAAAAAVSFLTPFPAAAASPESVVRGFLQDVRSGRHPEFADQYLAAEVLAHQVTSEGESVVARTPANYEAHVRDFLALFGAFRFEVTELIAADDRVYVRWRQEGRHLASFDGEPPTGAPLVDIASAVYRVRGGRIVEYWIQSDRAGLQAQLDRAARKPVR
jgi:predicted ester cyclase